MAAPKKHSSTITANDGRRNNGRKPGFKVKNVKKVEKLTPAKLNKAKKERIQLYAINAIRTEFGSEEEFFMHLARESKKSYNHLKLMMEYGYGKPSEDSHSGGEKKAPVINFYGNPTTTPIDNTIEIEHDED